MAERVDWTNADDPQDVVHQLVERLYEGHTVLFPTAATYALAAYAERTEGTERIMLARRSDDWSPTLAVHDAEACLALAGAHSDAGRRIIERGLPGPLTLLLPPIDDEDLLPPETRAMVVHQNKLAVRVPAHEAIIETLRLLPEPMILMDGPPAASRPEAALEFFGNLVDILVDDGPTPFGKPTTVIEVTAPSIEIRREGVVPRGRVHRLASEIITFVCTGNTCRSPMAEALFRKLLADSLGVNPDALPDHGFIIQSAGLSAHDGASAADEAINTVKDQGGTLEDHVAQSLTHQMVHFSDRIYVMTRDHRSALVSHWPEASAKTALLGGRHDVADPIGGDQARYRQCAGQITTHLQQILADIKSRRRA
ncbi:Sua5/YciO/YrdC/YwlC family protein [bacterium]|jgi:tRNA threonylcarbamoyl adenosine modification protein (Sua5/YciO/YrdC/YwlC family)|nr:Sua5/YciO/YrdC/YwlC family protein [bacterium]